MFAHRHWWALLFKNVERAYFKQNLECTAPKRWSKYKTLCVLLKTNSIISKVFYLLQHTCVSKLNPPVRENHTERDLQTKKRNKHNKTGLQPVSRPVEQILGFFQTGFNTKMKPKCVQKI